MRLWAFHVNELIWWLLTSSEVTLKHVNDRRRPKLSFVRVITTRRLGPNGPKRGAISEDILLTNGRRVTTVTAAASQRNTARRFGNLDMLEVWWFGKHRPTEFWESQQQCTEFYLVIRFTSFIKKNTLEWVKLRITGTKTQRERQ